MRGYTRAGDRVYLYVRPDMINRPYASIDEESFKWVALQYGNNNSDPVIEIEIELPRWLGGLLTRLADRLGW